MSEAVFYFDFNSPYAYLAAERIDDLVPAADWRPIAYPILLGQLGRLDQAIENVDRSRIADEIAGRAAQRGLPPFAPPDAWPLESWSLAPMRAALVAGEHGRIREFSRAAFRKAFVEGRALTELENILDAAREAGLEPGEVERGLQRPEIKDGLKGNTDEARARGVSGIPTVAIGDELFWGDDRLEEAAAAANTAD